MVPKFRAWDKESKSMHQILEIIYSNDLSYISFITIGGGNLIYGPKRRLGDDVIIMQSTGLKDKNGVEIFEGDIVVNQYGNVGYVAYLQQEAGFVVVKKKSDYRLGHRNTGESYDVTTNHEVIGNIHSNPELLDKADEN